eukprot:Gregarina_sp_Pseudo_9__3579@NODE_373_length_3017_cov_31_577233_g352_i0_p2_GENE_NODE_373_length_3017_cov_31_577233_g352_i0NODE_373_length_3017_cov_31_577233_g352_i0_p2_ORF_typecomplete_len295_score62_32Pinin_SDK_memA/PF04696_13/5_7e02Pinin_SDK_memA/PF04696_13/2_8e03Pinin_SDK_memA/PF04696_13/2_2e17GIT_CC/PF16559_5/1_3e02GIT_CC/PF16559_5/0_00064GIT_CC/PF16559_5/2_8e02Prp19/PF08606_11/4_2e02Prp19/PF08606_11/0_15MAM1/PF10434_9/0_22PG_binding_2/PF08823_11/3_1PG_binding_2/PF08823_11/69Hamartin/PF04388_
MHKKSEEKLGQLRAEIAAFVHERASLKDSLRRVQGALRHETRQLSAKSETETAPADKPEGGEVEPDTPKGDNTPSKKRPRSVITADTADSPPAPAAADKAAAASEEAPAAADSEKRASAAEAAPAAKRPRIELDDSAKQRTAKLFGHLMGHLKKAKARLESERDTKTAELQQDAARRVQEKLEREKTAQAEARIQTLKATEASLKEKLRRLQWEISCRETLCLRCQLEIHYTIMQGFIKTTAEPTLFWVPRVHNEETRNLQQETAAQIEKKIRSLHEQLRTVPYEEWVVIAKPT